MNYEFMDTPIGRLLLSFRKEFVWVVIFSAFANLLMLTPTIYMLQVFDRVFFSHNLVTLAALTVLLVFFLAVMAFAEWVRSMLLVRRVLRLTSPLVPSSSPARIASSVDFPDPDSPINAMVSARLTTSSTPVRMDSS